MGATLQYLIFFKDPFSNSVKASEWDDIYKNVKYTHLKLLHASVNPINRVNVFAISVTSNLKHKLKFWGSLRELAQKCF